MSGADEPGWEGLLDSLTAQVDLQEDALRRGTPPPADLEVDPPSTPLSAADRQRVIVLFERCESLLMTATRRLTDTGRRPRSAYRNHR